MAVYLRVCTDCGEEYQPHMTRCVECGGVLKDVLEGDSAEAALPPAAPEPSLPPGDYHRVASGLSASTVARLIGRFRAAGIPVKVEPAGHHMSLSARAEEMAAVIEVLQRQGVVPKQPDADEPAVGTEGARCPACGTDIGPGTEECPECGLLFDAGAGCEGCGAELSPGDEVCAACGRRQD